MELRPHQIENAEKIADRLVKYKLCYFQGAVRIGKTLCALQACKLYKAKNVLFLTKKKAISSIEGDYKDFKFTYKLTVINYESLHKIEDNNFDVTILDESHTLSGFPKKSKRVGQIKKRFSKIPMIYLTGTAAVESGSQWYHQFFVSDYSPFKEYTTFYKWAKEFVKVHQVDYGFGRVNNYENANRDKIQKVIDPYLITFTQKEAGFKTEINEQIIYYEQSENIIKLSNRLIKDRVIEGKDDAIIADTAVKLQSKTHQILNGSCILESGKTQILCKKKAEFIKDKFKGKKIAIFYYFKAELDILKQVFGNITDDLDEFNSGSCNIAMQQMSTEGVNLSKADCIVYYNFGFSGKNYIQSRDRMLVMGRESNDIYFVFARGGINEKIYKQVRLKKNFNVKQFNKEYGIPEQSKKRV